MCEHFCAQCLGQTGIHSCTMDSESRLRLIQRLKEKLTRSPTDRRITILRSLMELREPSAHQLLLHFLRSFERTYERADDYSERLSENQCAALADLLQRSEEVLEELAPKVYRTSAEGCAKLVPAVSNCRQADFERLDLSQSALQMVVWALSSSPSVLTLLDLSGVSVVMTQMQLLCEGLQSPNCRLELLRLYECSLTEVGCSSLVSALKSNPTHLKVVDFHDNPELGDSGVEHLCGFLQRPDCHLQILGLFNCGISSSGCCSLASALMSNPSHLRELQLGQNPELNTGVERLCGFLQSPHCRLEVLGLYDCGCSKSVCWSLASALKENPSHLRELTLSSSGLKRTDLRGLLELQRSPDCRLETLLPWDVC